LTILGIYDKLIYSLKTSSQNPAFPAAKPANPPSLVLATKPGSDLGYFLRWVGRILGAIFVYNKKSALLRYACPALDAGLISFEFSLIKLVHCNFHSFV